jgi:uncharacterized protein involved in type VI secretion and phage assembly
MIAPQLAPLCIGVVSELDPTVRGRVRVKLSHLPNVESDWCSVVTPMGGADRGLVMLPEKGDHVLVGFEHGDLMKGFVLGAVWNQTVTVPQAAGQPDENNERFIKSRSGHLLRFDDTPDGERIEIIDGTGQHRIVVDSVQNTITLESQRGTVNVLAPNGKVNVECKAASVKAESFTIEASTIDIKASGAISITADGTLTLKGATVNIN